MVSEFGEEGYDVYGNVIEEVINDGFIFVFLKEVI